MIRLSNSGKGKRFFCSKTSKLALRSPKLFFSEYQVSLQGVKQPDVKLTSDLNVMLIVRVSRAVALLSLYACMAYVLNTLSFYLYLYFPIKLYGLVFSHESKSVSKEKKI